MQEATDREIDLGREGGGITRPERDGVGDKSAESIPGDLTAQIGSKTEHAGSVHPGLLEEKIAFHPLPPI